MEIIPRSVPTLTKLNDLATANKLIPGELFEIVENSELAFVLTSSTYIKFYNSMEIDTKIGNIEILLGAI